MDDSPQEGEGVDRELIRPKKFLTLLPWQLSVWVNLGMA